MPRSKKLNSIENRSAREKLPSDIEKFLAAGGKIQQFEPGATGDKRSYGRNYNQKEGESR